ncbi:hypothetical protein PPYR_14888, partial [Photinus pyralis]
NDRKEFGNSAIFQILIDELIFLQSVGILIDINGQGERIYFALGLVLGDNLGLHSLLGMVESFSATYHCRFCLATKNHCKNLCKEDVNLLRTKSWYDEHIKPDTLDLGIKEICIFNQINGFHFSENYAVDIMHDVLEGVCNYVMTAILQKFILDLKLFSLEILNYRIKTFNFGIHDINRPPRINRESLNTKLRMSASEMLSFCRYFGLIIGDMIPRNNHIWQTYLLLKKLLDIILSPILHRNTYIVLNDLILDFLTNCIDVLHLTLKPKFHHLIHYGRVFRMSGPLMLHWSMRFEAKHRESK